MRQHSHFDNDIGAMHQNLVQPRVGEANKVITPLLQIIEAKMVNGANGHAPILVTKQKSQ
jgi:hypothetical protein